MSRHVVLVVDDEQLTREVLTVVLESDELEVHTAGSGGEALDLAARVQPTIALLDLMMPGMDGFDLCRKLREQQEDLRVIVLSARDDAYARDEAKQAGASDYLVKPYSARDLFASIESSDDHAT